MLLRTCMVLLCSLCGTAVAGTATTSISVGAIKPVAPSPVVVADVEGAGETLNFVPPAGEFKPGDTVTQTVSLSFEPPQNAPQDHSSTLAVAVPDLPGYQFSCRVNGQDGGTVSLQGEVRLEVVVQVNGDGGLPLSGLLIATVTAN